MFYRISVTIIAILLIVSTVYVCMDKEEKPIEKPISPMVIPDEEVTTIELLRQVCSIDEHELKHISSMVDDASRDEDVPKEIIMAVISTETGCKWMVGDNGRSIGYGQIQMKFWSKGKYNPSNPIDNIYLTAEILKKNYKDTDDWTSAIEVYNIGMMNYRKNKARVSGKEYVGKVTKRLKKMQQYKNKHDEIVYNGLGSRKKVSYMYKNNLTVKKFML